MDYKSEYDICFSDSNYSSDWHIQYSLCLDYIKEINIDSKKTLVDIGSGRGYLLDAILKLNNPNIHITSCDLNKYHKVDVPFKELDLSNKEKYYHMETERFDILTCLDVLEHLDESYIEDVILLFSKIAETSFLAIANHSDMHHGIELHTLQRDFIWWKNLLSKYFNILCENSYINDKLYVFIVKSK